jgi:hypothetical protein
MKQLLYLILLSGFALAAGCKKFVSVGAPLSEVESSKVFFDNQATLSAALGVYANMGLSGLQACSGGSTVYPALSADELTYTSTNAELLSFQHNAVIANSGTGIYSRLWVPAYSTIYQANSILQGLSGSAGVADTIKRQVQGEMLVVRSLNYFYLANLFGNVPLELTTDYKTNNTLGRTPVPLVYSQLAGDLKTAVGLLTPAYPGAANTRPNKWTAAALLARVCLYQKDWVGALAQSSAVINAGLYSLESDPANVFGTASAETIWQLANDYHNTAEGSAFVPASATALPAYALTSFLKAAFEPGDRRSSSWLKKNTVKGVDYYYPYKYKVRVSQPVSEYYVVLRLAEQYLIRAEARAELGDLAGAKEDLNLLRSRAGLSAVATGDQALLLQAIAKERQTELFCEWGNRWLDLKRTGKADAVLSAEKAGWNPAAALYPVPLSELQHNPNLVQNPGY